MTSLGNIIRNNPHDRFDKGLQSDLLHDVLT